MTSFGTAIHPWVFRHLLWAPANRKCRIASKCTLPFAELEQEAEIGCCGCVNELRMSLLHTYNTMESLGNEMLQIMATFRYAYNRHTLKYLSLAKFALFYFREVFPTINSEKFPIPHLYHSKLCAPSRYLAEYLGSSDLST